MNEQLIVSGKRKAISNWLRKFGTDVMPDKNKYWLNESLLGIFKWRKEMSLPEIDYVLIFKQVFAKCETCSIDERENNIHAYFQVSLVHHKTIRIVVHQTKNEQEALELATILSKELKKPLRDSARPKKTEK